ncbi:tryptophan 2,3- dioxygenase [Coemansia sp. RSA 2598]|nr:tryptophan 2,3- dioxygenase [Coemansia sp. RSA 2598]
MKSFRDKHIMIVTRYILAQARNGPSVSAPSATPVSSHIIPRSAHDQAMAQKTTTSQSGGRLGGDSLPADPTMYPQTNAHAAKQAASSPAGQPSHHRSSPAAQFCAKSTRLARKVDDESVVRGTGGTDAIQFLKQVRNETAHTRIGR